MLGSRAIAGDATEKRAGHAVTCPRPRDSPYITPPHVTHLRDNLMGRGSRGKAAGRTPEFPTQVPTRLSGRRGCWSRQGQQHARADSGAPSWRQAESGRVLPAQRTRVSFVGTALEWVLPLTLGGSTVSRAQRHKLVPGPQSTGLIPCGQAIERPMLSSVAMPSPLSPVSSTC